MGEISRRRYYFNLSLFVGSLVFCLACVLIRPLNIVLPIALLTPFIVIFYLYERSERRRRKSNNID